jgi:hypothetical protein
VGRVVDGQVRSGNGVFLDAAGDQQPAEYHVGIEWEAIVDAENAISAREAATAFGYSLPVRSVFGKMHRGRRASSIERELRERAIAQSSS